MNPLAESLARLSAAVRATATALEALQAALDAAPEGCSRYEAAGSPFGTTPRARSLWTRFAQATTAN